MAPQPASLLPTHVVVHAGGTGQLHALGFEAGWRTPWHDGGGAFGLDIEAGLTHWRPHSGRELAVMNVSPNLRYLVGDGFNVEAGIGFSAMTHRYANGECHFSTGVNFVDHLGLSWTPGPGRPEVGLRLVHLSNGGARQPNPGQNEIQFRLRWPLAS